MPNLITVYFQNEVLDLDIETIKRGVAPADWWILGEIFGIDEAEVSEFMRKVQWQDNLEIGLEKSRPIQIDIENDPQIIKESIEEVFEKTVPISVRQHLEKIKTIITLEFGFTQTNTMIEIIAFEIAYWLSETKNGLIRSFDDNWYDFDKNRWNPIE